MPSQSPGSAQGFAYSYDDTDVEAGQTYWYWLEDISLSGATTLHGPVSGTVNAPTTVRLGELDATSEPRQDWPIGLGIVAAVVVRAAMAGVRRHRRRTWA